MKAAVFYGPRDIRTEEVENPVLGPGDILIKVRACGICGSDLHTYAHGLFETLGIPMGNGRVMGHELSGEVVEINGDAPGLKVGDRICSVGMGGNAEYIKIRAAMTRLVIQVPDDISFVEAATTEPLATSVHAVNLASPKEGETHVIMGAGIIGLGVLQMLKTIANVKTFVVDLAQRRLDMAKDMGADVLINASEVDAFTKIQELTGTDEMSFMPEPTGRADTVYDCAGLPKTFTGTSVLQQAVSMVRENGKVVMVAVYEKGLEFEPNMVVRKGVTLYGSWAWTSEELFQAGELIASGKIDRKPLISHEFSLDDSKEAYEIQLKPNEAIKVMLTP